MLRGLLLDFDSLLFGWLSAVCWAGRAQPSLGRIHFAFSIAVNRFCAVMKYFNLVFHIP